jgi:perosamine synthetase
MYPSRMRGEDQKAQVDIRPDFLPFGKPNFGEEEIAAVATALRSGWIGMGPETIAFEKELAEYLNVPYVVTVNSCTSALFLSLLVCGIGPGDEVICPSMTWCATANAVLYLGAHPVFCDIDSSTMCVTPATIAAKVSPKTKAVMIVHYGGLAADIDAIRAILPARVVIVEDAAHALGAKFPDGRPVGCSGNLTCFSFYANKNLSTGEGGAIALFNDEHASRLRSLRQNGLPSDAWTRYSHPQTVLTHGIAELGYKMNFTDLQACIGRVQLKRQSEFHLRRLAIARHYHDGLGALSLGIGFQNGALDEKHSRHLLVVTLPIEKMRVSRNSLILKLRERNVGASIHYAPLHLMPLYQAFSKSSLPETERLSARNVTLPISASMDLEDADYVLSHITELLDIEKRSYG